MSMVLDFIQTAAVLILLAYLLSRANFFPVVRGDEKLSGGKRIAAIVVFLFLSFYGLLLRSHLASGLYVDTRLVGIVLSGLLFGPGVSLFVLVPVGAVSVFLGGETLWADLAAMLLGALLSELCRRRFPRFDSVLAGIIAGVLEVCHMLLIVAIVQPESAAKALVYQISFPSIVVNGCAVILFILIVTDVYDHRRLWEHESFLRSESRVAAEIQGDLLEKDFEPDERLDLSAFLQPAYDVGGDLYSFTLCEDRYFKFIVGDVSGKGVPAAISMSRCETLFHELANRESDPAAILSALNVRMSRNNHTQTFVTAWAGVLDLETGRLLFANAGHVTPYILRCGEVPEALPRLKGFPLGLFPEEQYRSCERVLCAGETVLTYSDGVTDAESPLRQRFGTARLEEALTALSDVDAAAVQETLLGAVHSFVETAPQADDITVFAFGLRQKGGETA